MKKSSPFEISWKRVSITVLIGLAMFFLFLFYFLYLPAYLSERELREQSEKMDEYIRGFCAYKGLPPDCIQQLLDQQSVNQLNNYQQ